MCWSDEWFSSVRMLDFLVFVSTWVYFVCFYFVLCYVRSVVEVPVLLLFTLLDLVFGMVVSELMVRLYLIGALSHYYYQLVKVVLSFCFFCGCLPYFPSIPSSPYCLLQWLVVI